jgi:VanZ family protein
MQKVLSILPRWFPALFMMLVILAFSSQPGHELPHLPGWDYFVKKTSHVLGYALLAMSYLYLLRYRKNVYWLAWLMTLAYAASDEFHQSFVPGRHASLLDVFVFDHIGAVMALLLHYKYSDKNEIYKT